MHVITNILINIDFFFLFQTSGALVIGFLILPPSIAGNGLVMVPANGAK